ncbi:MAG: choice-of-anchor L domain-containing protein, partial [Saprospiraceae bacterium]|nr:choice-of-anchor L domain-containing protein [Saprospiraceae bacterium]
MKREKLKTLSAIMSLLYMAIGSGIYAQSILPQINGDPVYLTEEVFIAGGCFDVSNAAVSGGFGAVGTFSNGENSIGISSGIILSTGSVLNASGPNTQTNYTTNFNNNNADPDLEQIIDNPVIPLMDVAILEFDFTPTSDYVTFEYVFASEEYCDFVNTLYNDVFGFFISGPGINGSFSNNAENIALVPGTADFVAINNINHLTNASYYIDNVPLDDPQVSSCPGGYPNSSGAAVNAIEFDGFTQVLTASSPVIPCETYHIKLVIGDVTDGQYDSAVFLGANSFEAGETVVVEAISPATGSNLIFEGCGDAYFLFQRFGTDLNVPLTVDFVIAANSTAVPGVDYEPIPLSVTFPQGVSSVTLPLQIFSDDMVEGQESLGIELESACSCFTTFAEFIIEDGSPLDGNLASIGLCGSETIVMQPALEGGIEPYEYAWSTGESSSQITFVPTHSETITLLVTDACGSSLELLSEISFTEPPIAILSGGVEYCGEQSTGSLSVEVTGEGPWELSYRIDEVLQPVITLQNSPFYFQGAEPGIYTLDHIEYNGCSGSVSGTGTVTINDLAMSASVADNFCFGQNAGSITLEISGGDPPYVVDWSNGAGNVWIQTDLPAGNYPVSVMDAGGCMIEETFIIEAPSPLEVDFAVQSISCFGANDGSLTILPSGGDPPYSYSINDIAFQNEPTFGNLTAGGYEIHLKDAHDCQIDGFVFIDEPALLAVSVEYESPVCLGMHDGYILVNATGGSGDYRYRLDEGVLQNDPLFADLPAGYYTLEVSDTQGCQEVFMIDLVSSPPFLTSLILTPSTCPGVPEGVIEVVTAGALGQPVYSLNGNAYQEVNVFSELSAGTYVISVMDESGCVVTLEALLTEPEWPAPEITGNAQMCTGTTQELSIIGSDQYYWSTGAQGNLTVIVEGGHYEVTIVDENGCLSFADFWVEEIPEPVVQIIGDNILCPGETSLLTLNENFEEVIWSDGTSGSAFEVLTPGTVSVT